MGMKVSGEVVRKLRLERGWTQEHLAAVCGASAKTIQRVEGSGLCSLEVRSALAAVLQIDAKQLDGVVRIEQAKGLEADGIEFYSRLTSGHAVVAVFEGSYWYRLTNEEARCREDVDSIAEALQAIHDWSEIWGDVDPGSKVKATFELGELLRELDGQGLWLFGLRTTATFAMPDGRSGNTKPMRGAVCNLHVAYADSDKIVVLDPVSQG
jgi:transcriptional regulator with XRE-family HTH domain